MSSTLQVTPATSELSDQEVVSRVLAGETPLFEILMRRYNQRIYRAARAILRDDTEAEDVMQEAYVRAYQHLHQFAGRAKFSTWLTRIAVNEALARLHRKGRFSEVTAPFDRHSQPQHTGDPMASVESSNPSPESGALNSELHQLLEKAIMALPENYRSVLVMRDVEELSTAEAAECLQISEENVKVRLHRARALVRRELYARTGETMAAAFQFHAVRCDRVVKHVLARIVQPRKPEALVC